MRNVSRTAALNRLKLFLTFFATAMMVGELRAGDRPRLRVLASFFPPACVALNIAGTNATVEVLLDGRTDPHDFQFTHTDLAKVTRADLLVLNGLGMESWLDRMLDKLGGAKPAVELAAGLGEGNLIENLGHESGHSGGEHGHHAHGNSEFNAHIWLDPRLLLHGVTNVMRALQQADPANAAAYATNAASFGDDLRKLDLELQQELAPVQNIPVVTWHDAFAYFARRYGPKVIGVVERVPEVDPAPRYLAELGRRCRTDGVQGLFDQPGVRSRLFLRLAADWQVPTATLDTLENHPLNTGAYRAAMWGNARILRKTLR